MTADGLAFRLGADVRCTVLEPHVERPYDPDDWRGALVLVQRGTLRVQCRSGHRAVFGRGSVLHLQDLTLRSISADGDDAAVLLAVLSARPGDSLHHPRGTAMTGVIATAQVDIAATPERVWASLTAPADIATYMEGARVDTTWQVGTPITWSGELNGHPYQDRGQVLTYDEPHVLSMTHFSPIMGQEDRPENYHTVVYTLSPLGDGTRLSLAQDNCADEQQAAQFSLHWQQMLDGLERLIEG